MPQEDLDKLIEMISAYIEEIPTEEGNKLKPKESMFLIPNNGQDFYESLPGFNDFEIFPKEIEILKSGDPLYFITKAIGEIHKGDRELVALNVLTGMSPWVGSETLHIYPVGTSGKGKTDLCSSTLHAFPQCSYEVITSSSPMSIFYAFGAGELAHNKIIFLDDIKIQQDFIDILKAFAGSSKVKPRHWTVDIHRKFIDMSPSADYSIWLTSVNPLKDDQLKNRFMIINVDESLKQDERVREHIDKTYRSASEKKILNSDEFQICQNMINILIQESKQVVIPFEMEFPMIIDRRAYIFFLVALKICTFMNKFQRESHGNTLIATRHDFEVVKAIWLRIKNQMLKLSEKAVDVLLVLPTDVESALSRSEIAVKVKGLNTYKVGKICAQLVAMGLVNSDKIGVWKYWQNQSKELESLFKNITMQTATEKTLVDLGIDAKENLDLVNKESESKIFEYFKSKENLPGTGEELNIEVDVYENDQTALDILNREEPVTYGNGDIE